MTPRKENDLNGITVENVIANLKVRTVYGIKDEDYTWLRSVIMSLLSEIVESIEASKTTDLITDDPDSTYIHNAAKDADIAIIKKRMGV